MSITLIFLIVLALAEVGHILLISKAPLISDILEKIVWVLIVVWIVLNIIAKIM